MIDDITSCEVTVFIGAIGGVIAMILSCILKSRCSKIRCCCFEVERDVIRSSQLHNVSVQNPV